MFFCLPIFFGCQTTLKPDGQEQSPRICPRCHNASVIAAKSTTWFELFWVPLVPFSKKHLWFCSICQWKAHITPGQGEPNTVGRSFQPGQYPIPNQGFELNHQPGYAPAYTYHTPQK